MELTVSHRYISKTHFKAHALEIFRQVEASGEAVVITDHGHPTLEIRPYQPAQENALDLLRSSVLRYDDPFAPVGEDDWEAAR
ncbi:prevent-host-death protein [Bordetella genomosp. 10]|uniref:Prevent-host-death protein n=1 Tax=Bordetella genomosp. 10 TaxID=1416804 RepID=A0A261RYZ5_9BORD|nr:type II toxin-antitoxin system Phd/YefM family antitoxin [Bordetella genomosp. 10]OZI30309.1 prevent-host-death protein [Bordetella genomosp. 10]